MLYNYCPPLGAARGRSREIAPPAAGRPRAADAHTPLGMLRRLLASDEAAAHDGDGGDGEGDGDGGGGGGDGESCFAWAMRSMLAQLLPSTPPHDSWQCPMPASTPWPTSSRSA